MKGKQSAQQFEFYKNESYDYIDEQTEEPTLYEIQEIIRNLKRMTTPGTDNVNAELLQAAGPRMTQRIQELMGISLLNTVYKILATATNNRLKIFAEDLLSHEQNGFRRNRLTTHNIFIMRQILEKCYEYNIEMPVLFIDFKQSFDSVDRQKIIQILQELRIPNKFVRLIKMTIQNTKASVKIENLTSNPFLITSGVRQGDPLCNNI